MSAVSKDFERRRSVRFGNDSGRGGRGRGGAVVIFGVELLRFREAERRGGLGGVFSVEPLLEGCDSGPLRGGVTVTAGNVGMGGKS